MKLVHGWHCPNLLSGPGNYLNKTGDARLALVHVRAFRFALQAGGHIGTWPVMLAREFDEVLTFEPEPENFACLQLNLAEKTAGNVTAVDGLLAEKRDRYAMLKSTRSTGQHRRSVRMRGERMTAEGFRIDDLKLERLDALFLDVEGSEINALRGGETTIRRHRPVIMAEENRRCADMGHAIGDLGRLLGRWGYRQVAAVNEDLVFVPGTAS